MNRMQELYKKEVAPALFKSLGLKNVMQVPAIEKIVLNIGLGEAMDNPKALDAAVADIVNVQKVTESAGHMRKYAPRVPKARRAKQNPTECNKDKDRDGLDRVMYDGDVLQPDMTSERLARTRRQRTDYHIDTVSCAE